MDPRPYQLRTIAESRARWAAGARSILIVLPTGAGKTFTAVLFLLASLAKGKRALWIAHRQELVQQAVDSLARCDVKAGIIAPWAPRSGAQVQVASTQTLLARGLDGVEFDVVVVDEAHHYVADEWIALVHTFRARGATILGLTATPERADGIALGNIFDSLVSTVQRSELISNGWLCPTRVLGPPAKHDSDYLADDVVNTVRQYSDGRRTIVFDSSVQSARATAAALSTAGFPSACIDGETDDATRSQAIADFGTGKVQVLTNVHVLTEGFDCPEAAVAIFARRFGAPSTYIQAGGRVARPAPGKTYGLIVDLRGSAREHGLLDEDRVYSLEGKAIQVAGRQNTLIAACVQCGTSFRASMYRTTLCPACGTTRKGTTPPEVRRAAIQQIVAREDPQRRVTFMRDLIFIAKHRGYKLGWASYKFKSKYGRWPTRSEILEASR